MDIEDQNQLWEESYDYDLEDEIGVCENCGKIREVFTSTKDGRKYCLKGCENDRNGKIHL